MEILSRYPTERLHWIVFSRRGGPRRFTLPPIRGYEQNDAGVFNRAAEAHGYTKVGLFDRPYSTRISAQSSRFDSHPHLRLQFDEEIDTAERLLSDGLYTSISSDILRPATREVAFFSTIRLKALWPRAA